MLPHPPLLQRSVRYKGLWARLLRLSMCKHQAFRSVTSYSPDGQPSFTCLAKVPRRQLEQHDALAKNIFVCDSGASARVTCNDSWIHEAEPINTRLWLAWKRQSITATLKRTINLETHGGIMKLTDVLYSAQAASTLVATPRLDRRGYHVTHGDGQLTITKGPTIVVKEKYVKCPTKLYPRGHDPALLFPYDTKKECDIRQDCGTYQCCVTVKTLDNGQKLKHCHDFYTAD